MDFYDILDQVLALLQRHQRVTYRAVQRQFGMDEDTLADLKDALLYAHPEVRDDAGRGLIWTGDPSTALPAASPAARTQDDEPLAYTPPSRAEKNGVIPRSRRREFRCL